MSKEADISDIDKYQLMRKLWFGAKWTEEGEAPFYETKIARGIFDKHSGNLKTVKVCGKFLNVDLSGDTVDPESYDLQNGADAFKNILESLRTPTEQSTTGPTANAQANEGSSDSLDDGSVWTRRARQIVERQGRLQ